MNKFTGNAGDFLKIGVAAAARGDLASVRAILKAKPKWIYRSGSHGRTMLWEACHKGKLEMVKYLVKRKADINACGSHYTPYFVEVSCYCIAEHKKHYDVAEFLLKKDAKIDIHTAAFLGDLERVKSLLKRSKKRVNEGHPQHEMGEKRKDGLDFFPAPAPWATPLCYALRGGARRKGDVATAEFLIQRGAKLKGLERELFIAADDQIEMVRLLLENGADAKFAPEVLPTDELYDLVAAHGGPVLTTADSEELVYLCRGDRGGNPQEVAQMLDQGADVNYQDSKGKTALHRAAKAGFIPTMEVLLKRKAKPNVEDNKGETALFDAARSTIKKIDRQEKAIQLLLKSGAKKSYKNRKNQTAFEVAKSLKRPVSKSILKLLK
jgi:ankyrin repeat protein